MSMTPFGTWLAEIGLGNYVDVFAANKIDFDVIHQMTDADLRELGLALGDRKRLLQAIARLNGQSATEVVTSASAREHARLWGSLRCCCDCPVVVCRAEPRIAPAEGVFERVVQHGGAHGDPSAPSVPLRRYP